MVMGMPFPNPVDPELCERMRFLDAAVSMSAKQPQSDEQSRKTLSCRSFCASPAHDHSLPQLSRQRVPYRQIFCPSTPFAC